MNTQRIRAVLLAGAHVSVKVVLDALLRGLEVFDNLLGTPRLCSVLRRHGKHGAPRASCMV